MSTAPLQATIERVLDDALLAEVAREHRKGAAYMWEPPISTRGGP